MAKLPHCLTALFLLLPLSASAQARFDLAGPKIDVNVTRGGVTLPISRVPNLQPGDQLWLHPDLPPTQSVHYLLIATFLRGTTNPPPDEWFTRIETWNRKVREEGVTVTVPPDAQQAILFLAPETGGDFSTLRSAVKGRPGVFVRASQDLTEAGFEQARIEKYLDSMRRVPPGDSAALVEHSNLLARTLNLRPNPDCFKRPLDQQLSCLTQTGTQTLLDDGHAQSIVAALSTGTSSDFINAASNTRLAAGGNYSAYVGAMVDLARLLNGIHTAQYQYIPAIAFPDSAPKAGTTEVNPAGPTAPSAPASLSLRLNTAPSFHNPKSVIVIGLPAVQVATPPPLRPAEPNHISCLLDPHMALPIEGAPLVFSTAYAHSLVLHLDTPTPTPDIPLVADPYLGGLAIAPGPPERHELPLAPVAPLGTQPAPAPTPAPRPPATPGAPITGTIQGMWGFDHFTGPTLPLQQLPGEAWHIVTAPAASADQPTNLIAGKPNHLQLLSTGTACIRSIALDPAPSSSSNLEWKLAADPTPAPHAATVPPVDLTLNLEHAATPGSIRLAILQFGKTDPDQLGTKTFSEPAKLDSLRIHAGDLTAALTGTSLDQVKSLTLRDTTYTPASPDANHLTLSTPHAPALKPNDHLTAKVELNDGRTLSLATTILPPRPEITLLSRRVVLPAPSPITLSSPDVLPLGAQFLFFLKSRSPIPRAEQIELASADGSLHTTLSLAAGSLILQDSHTLLATFDPLKTFGPSTFGPFRLRALAPDGTEGEWLPLATIVRLPTLTALRCPHDPAAPCLLDGQALYLIDAIAPDLAFTTPIPVPEGFVDSTLQIPHPPAGTFYLRLRDDPSTTHQTTLPITPEK